jgi:hypothetical protein
MLTSHDVFLEQALWRDARLLVDTRNVIPPGPDVRHI